MMLCEHAKKPAIVTAAQTLDEVGIDRTALPLAGGGRKDRVSPLQRGCQR